MDDNNIIIIYVALGKVAHMKQLACSATGTTGSVGARLTGVANESGSPSLSVIINYAARCI